MIYQPRDTTKVSAPYRYALSVPERVVRSLSALSGGLLREIGAVVVPASLRRTALYRTIVEVTLRFLIEQVGQVEGVYASEAGLAQDFLLKRAAAHGIDMVGLLTIHASPIWVLAALADATGAGHRMILEISQALKDEGLLNPDQRFENVDEILDGLEKTSAHLAQTLYMPPVDIAGLRREWTILRDQLPKLSAANMPSLDRLERLWDDLRRSAAEQNRSIFALSSLLAVSVVAHVPARLVWLSRVARSAARRTSIVLGGTMLDHYSAVLNEVSQTGFLEYWRREFRPYLRAAARQFAPGHTSSTERLLRRERVR